MSYDVDIELVEGKVVKLTDWFEGECPEKEAAGRHFKGNCTWEYDLTEEEDVIPSQRGMYYMHGFADGDWGTEFIDHNFVSNDKIKEAEEKRPYICKIKLSHDVDPKVIENLREQVNSLFGVEVEVTRGE